VAATVVFIHGEWLTPASWDLFKSRYTACAFDCLAPAWPCIDGSFVAGSRRPHPGLGRLSVARVVDHYDELIRKLPAPPLLVGHSCGGLFVQVLLDRGLGAAGIAINAVPPRGVLPGVTALRGVLPFLLTWNGWNRIQTMTLAQFSRNFAQSLAPDEQRAVYGRHVVPTSGRILYQAAFGIGTRVDYANDCRAPLLLIAGEKDRIVQSSMVASNYRKYLRSATETAFKSFTGRTHWSIAETGWEDVADYTIEWANTSGP
jgi:pimeloyl-ACP methyl ester carboxylesterase